MPKTCLQCTNCDAADELDSTRCGKDHWGNQWPMSWRQTLLAHLADAETCPDFKEEPPYSPTPPVVPDPTLDDSMLRAASGLMSESYRSQPQ